jgi:hypothetical protein
MSIVVPNALNLRLRLAETGLSPLFMKWLRETVTFGMYTEEQSRICQRHVEDWVESGI